MKKIFLVLGFGLLCLAIPYLMNLQKAPKAVEQQSLDPGHLNYPNDASFLIRSYPDKSFDIRAFENAKKEAKQAMLSRTPAQGFDEPWTTQGPSNIGARINSIAVHPTLSDIIYVGFSGGGVFKTTNGGAFWVPIFDDQLYLSISDIVLDPNDPETVYVATGDHNISGYPAIGDGIYKSTDGGGSWNHIGLTAQRIVSKIIVDPNNSNTIYAATMGLPFERNNDRGLYKTTDGGANWSQVLFVSNEAGIIDMVMDPNNSNVLYASSWNRIRNNQESMVSGTDGAVWKTTDSGANWTMLGGGLPTGDVCRIGLQISATNSNVLYAEYVGANTGNGYQLQGIFKTSDAGSSWTDVDALNNGIDDNILGGFGWYFGKIRIDPTNDNRLFVLGVSLYSTNDSGNNWNWDDTWATGNDVHADKHDLAFLANGDILLATDGGLYRSTDNAVTWADADQIATTQFYRVAYNPNRPDRYYGGAQDNGTMYGNAAGISTWERYYGGDGFQALFHPTDINVHFAEYQNGNIGATYNDGVDWVDLTDGFDFSEPRHWDFPYIMSAANPQRLYSGTDRVYSLDYTYTSNSLNGTWQAISPDLTDGPTSLSFRRSITGVEESPVNTSILYAGTTDGNVWKSIDTGNNWTEITGSLPNRYVSSVKASPDSENTVYVTHSGYRDNDFIPHIHRSDNAGQSWTDISANLPPLAINDVFIIPGFMDNILFVATDGGIYGTVDAGLTWERLGINMPIIPVYDLEYNLVENTLVAGTFARSIMSYSLNTILDEDVSVKQVQIEKKKNLSVYPTVASNQIQIEFTNIEPGKTASLALVSMDGRILQEQAVEGIGKQQVQMNVENLAAGNYFVRLKIRSQLMTRTFMKQ